MDEVTINAFLNEVLELQKEAGILDPLKSIGKVVGKAVFKKQPARAQITEVLDPNKARSFGNLSEKFNARPPSLEKKLKTFTNRAPGG